MRIAAIDIGTNSIHMVIAGTTEGGGFEVVDREREVTQIGRGSFRTGMLQRAAIKQTLEALESFALLARRMGADRILCTATAAVREARNGGAFIQEARRRAGIIPRVIPSEEEGRLIYLAVRSAVALDDEPSLILDIGGGSVQFVVGTREALKLAVSSPLGALRLTEEFLEDDPPGRAELRRLERRIRRLAAEPLAAVKKYKPRRLYGSSGSIHALAELSHLEETGTPLQQLNGHVLTTDQLSRLIKRIRRMSLAEREALRGLDDRRAEILLPGALVLEHVLEALDAASIVVTDFGVREGLVTDYVGAHAREISTVGAVEDLRMRSVLQLLQKFQPEERHLRHARQVTALALSLFDGFRRRHRLSDDDRSLFEYAALLHDVGAAVGYDGHADHSYYLIRHGNLRGLDADQVEMIALLARFHGRGRPRKRQELVRALGKRRRRKLRWMAAMLRVAEALDRSHYQLVRSVRVTRRGGRTILRVDARRGAGLELWAARRRVDLLERLLDARVRIDRDGVERGRRGAARVRREPLKIVPLKSSSSAAAVARAPTGSARKSSQPR
jgi:exopolyphosphatase/guanosine-5'-triphosphate,3'-diphosphate pyrophosphatase